MGRGRGRGGGGGGGGGGGAEGDGDRGMGMGRGRGEGEGEGDRGMGRGRGGWGGGGGGGEGEGEGERGMGRGRGRGRGGGGGGGEGQRGTGTGFGSGSGSGRPARGSSTAGGGPRKRGAPNRHKAAYSVPPGKVEAGGPWRHPEPPGADTCRVSGGGSACGVGWGVRAVGGSPAQGRQCAAGVGLDGVGEGAAGKAQRGPRSATASRLAPTCFHLKKTGPSGSVGRWCCVLEGVSWLCGGPQGVSCCNRGPARTRFATSVCGACGKTGRAGRALDGGRSRFGPVMHVQGRATGAPHRESVG